MIKLWNGLNCWDIRWKWGSQSWGNKRRMLSESPVLRSITELKRFIELLQLWDELSKNLPHWSPPKHSLPEQAYFTKRTTNVLICSRNVKDLICSSPVVQAKSWSKPLCFHIDPSENTTALHWRNQTSLARITFFPPFLKQLSTASDNHTANECETIRLL